MMIGLIAFQNLFTISKCTFFRHDYRDFHNYWTVCDSEKTFKIIQIMIFFSSFLNRKQVLRKVMTIF